MKKKLPKNVFQTKIESVLTQIHDDLSTLTNHETQCDKIKELVAHAIEMEFEDWDTIVKCSIYDPQVE